ncbi:helix-turn-helix transcriptional regulator [Ensifer soli]|uniref:helix-turn-helix transcriptional regulator n=1 Tax=Ciceribacter sp. sgz301302 TaxID=3342379 RepID=UPI0035B9D0A2
MTDRTERASIEGARREVFEPAPRAGAPTEYEALRLIRQMAQDAGYAGFLVARMPFGADTDFAERLVISSWPADLVHAYHQSGQFAASALVRRLRTTKIPVFAEAALMHGDPAEAGALAERFRAEGFIQHCAMLLHSTLGEPFLFLLSGRRAAPEAAELAGLYLHVIRLFEYLEGTFEKATRDGDALSAREIECLRWAAAGKSSDEIAIILGISGYTVASYFKSAARKLDAVNRMQAIARAIRLRLF